jgi:hypothetical protein
MMPMATATNVKPHDPSAGTSIIHMVLSWRKASHPRSNEDGAGEEAVGGGVGRRRTTRVVDVDVGRARRLRGRDGGDGGRWRPCASFAEWGASDGERRYCSPSSYVNGLSLRRLRRSLSASATGAVVVLFPSFYLMVSAVFFCKKLHDICLQI